jgi:hypothetical protein
MGVLRVNIGGEWIDISGNGGTDEVRVGSAEPPAGVELWYDTDDTPELAAGLLPAGGAAGQVLAKTSAVDYAAAWQNQDALGSLSFYATRTGSDWLIPTASTWHAVPLNNVVVNVGNAWQAASNEWKAPKSGFIEVTASTCLVMSAAASPNFMVGIWNGAVEYRMFQAVTVTTTGWAMSGARVIQVAANDLVSLKVWIAGQAPSNYIFNQYTSFSVRYVGVT